MIILLDCDGVLTHTFVDYAVAFAQASGVEHASARTITDFNIFKAWGVPEMWGPFNAYVARPGMVADMVPADGAREAVERLRSAGRVFAATTPNSSCPHWMYERQEWLVKHMGFDRKDVFTVHQKHMLAGDVLIDDAAHNVETFPRHSILIDQPWNQTATVFGCRAESLAHAAEAVEAIR